MDKTGEVRAKIVRDVADDVADMGLGDMVHKVVMMTIDLFHLSKEELVIKICKLEAALNEAEETVESLREDNAELKRQLEQERAERQRAVASTLHHAEKSWKTRYKRGLEIANQRLVEAGLQPVRVDTFKEPEIEQLSLPLSSHQVVNEEEVKHALDSSD